MATSHLPSASSRAAAIDAPAIPRTYSLRPGKGAQSYVYCMSTTTKRRSELSGVLYVFKAELFARHVVRAWWIGEQCINIGPIMVRCKVALGGRGRTK